MEVAQASYQFSILGGDVSKQLLLLLIVLDLVGGPEGLAQLRGRHGRAQLRGHHGRTQLRGRHGRAQLRGRHGRTQALTTCRHNKGNVRVDIYLKYKLRDWYKTIVTCYILVK